jgi:hypothetical protein
MGNLEDEYDILKVSSSFPSGKPTARTKTKRILSV